MSPLVKRLPRQFKSGFGKWFGIVALITVVIALVASFLVANVSLQHTLSTVDADYHVEDGRFTTNFEMKQSAIDAVEDLGCTVYKNYSYDLPLTIEGDDSGRDITVRAYKQRTDVDLAVYSQGAAPASDSEIALDRCFCAGNDLDVGDTVRVNGQDFTVCGIMVMSDYQALFEKNSDFVFNNLTFSVAEVTPAGFDKFKGESCSYTYSYVLDDQTMDDVQRTDFEERMTDVLDDHDVMLTDFMDKSANQAIGYALEDMTGDRLMYEVLLYMIIAIMAFVFVVLISATIESESSVIGTLLASGYSKRELIAHYMALPTIAGLLGAIIGNALGYGIFVDTMAGLYMHSYSLPPYTVVFDPFVFCETTVFPIALLLLITLIGLVRKLGCTPLQFLRHETSRQGRKGGMKLPAKLSFGTRFRLRVFGRNLSHFVTLFFGIMFASLLLLFGLCMLPTMDNYAQSLAKSLVSEHAYNLKAPVEIDGTPEQRAQYSAALTLADMVDMSDIDEDEVEDKLSTLLEDRIEADVESQMEDLFDEDVLTSIVQGKVEALFNADALQQVIVGRIAFDEDKVALLTLISTLAPSLVDVNIDADNMTSSDIQALVDLGVIKSKYVNLSDYGLGQVDITDTSSFSSGIDSTSDLNWGKMAADGIVSSTKVDLSYYGLGVLDLAQTTDFESYFDDLDTDNLQWARLVDAGILKSSEVDLTPYGIGVVDLATFDSDSITVDDLDFDAMDFSSIDFAEIGLGSVDLGTMSKNEFFKLLVKASDIDEEAHVVNTKENSAAAIAQAEKFSSASVEYDRGNDSTEPITMYGIQPGSRYWQDVDVSDGKVVFGQGLANKFGMKVGETYQFYNKYKGKTYELTCAAFWGSESNMNVYMDIDALNALVGNDAGDFSGYVSDMELQFDDRYLANDVTPAQMDKIGAQMENSMGDMMYMILAIAAIIYVILMYLLTKTVIERSARAISYLKVFGYANGEINKLYLLSITEVVVASLILAIPVIVAALGALIQVVFMSYNGYFVMCLPADRLVLEVLVGVVCYALVALFHSRRIKRIPLALALKIQE